jgi:hypothetical protein
MAAKQVTVPDGDTVLDVVGTVAVAYVGWVFAGGPPIPFLKEFVPFIVAVAAGIVAWRIFRKNNEA